MITSTPNRGVLLRATEMLTVFWVGLGLALIYHGWHTIVEWLRYLLLGLGILIILLQGSWAVYILAYSIPTALILLGLYVGWATIVGSRKNLKEEFNPEELEALYPVCRTTISETVVITSNS